MSSYPKSEAFSEYSKPSFITRALRLCRFYAVFRLGFLSFLLIQPLAFLVFFSHARQSIFSAVAIAIFFLTGFSYFVLSFFLEGQKKEKILDLRQTFSSEFSLEGTPLQRARMFLDTVGKLDKEEERLYKSSPSFFSSFALPFTKIKIRLYFENFLLIKGSLLSGALEELAQEILLRPLDPEIHELLAEIYLRYAELYLPSERFPRIPNRYFSSFFREQFALYSQRALEECTVLEEEGESGIGLRTMQAYLYELRGEEEKEMTAREALHALAPDNPEYLFSLGVLYFRSGKHAKGLATYGKLRILSPDFAENLILRYPLTPSVEEERGKGTLLPVVSART